MVVFMLLARIDVASADEAIVPKSDVQFGGQCTEGLAEGKHVMTKCATQWTDKDGKVCCFSGEDAKKSFLENPNDKTGRELKLEFVDTHQPVRQLDDDGHYFACTDFRVVGTKDQIYDIDF
jgi:hypothetical protein